MLRLILVALYLGQCTSEAQFALNILHYNDFHARFVETSPSGGICNAEVTPCIGGFARLTTAVRQALDTEPNSLLLNGGDSFQGTLWYNIFRWNVTQEFMNLIPHDAHVLGNHEFDNGIEGVVPYLQHLKAPVVTANINDDLEPSIQGLYNKSIIVEKEGRQIGIIGVLIASTPTMASTERLEFTDEVTAVREEAEKLNAQGVKIIVVLSHCGIDIDRDIALNGGPYIDVIVGAHSHTLLYNGEAPENSGFEVRGSYPTVVEQDGRPVLIVQAAAHTQYLGELKVYFDDDGTVLDWEGNPHYLGNHVEQAPDILEKINEYLPLVEERSLEEIGNSLVYLSSDCRCGECNLGSLICDAYLDAVLDRAEVGYWNYAHFSIMNRGDIRAPIEPGVITFGSVITTAPFENNVEVFELKGEHILEMLEFAVANTPFAGARMLQFSGLHAVFNGSQPVNNRVVEATIRCIECEVPRYEPLDVDKYYRMISQNFVGQGGDGFTMIRDNRINVEVVGIDYDLIMRYIRKITPVFAQVEGRIDITSPCLE